MVTPAETVNVSKNVYRPEVTNGVVSTLPGLVGVEEEDVDRDALLAAADTNGIESIDVKAIVDINQYRSRQETTIY